jgi:hypothetical protein
MLEVWLVYRARRRLVAYTVISMVRSIRFFISVGDKKDTATNDGSHHNSCSVVGGQPPREFQTPRLHWGNCPRRSDLWLRRQLYGQCSTK